MSGIFYSTSVYTYYDSTSSTKTTVFATEAAGQQCHLCAFPQLFLADALRRCATAADDMQDMQKLAAALGIALAIPYAEKAVDENVPGSRLYQNSCMLIGANGERLLNYRKCGPRLHREKVKR